MAKEYQNDGQNRCRRCNKPLSNPNDNYGWWCAKLVGLDFYVEEDRKLDYASLNSYNENRDLIYLSDIAPAYVSDKARYGENSKVFIALDNLKQAYEKFPLYKDAIDIVDNEIRWIGNEWGSAKIDERVTEFYSTRGGFAKYYRRKSRCPYKWKKYAIQTLMGVSENEGENIKSTIKCFLIFNICAAMGCNIICANLYSYVRCIS